MTPSIAPTVFDLCSETGIRVFAQRSLSPVSTRTVLGAAWAVAATGTAVATYHGVWPVGIFLTITPLALTAAFSVNNKDAKSYEMLRFHDGNFEVAHYDALGRLSANLVMPAYHTRFIGGDLDAEDFSITAIVQQNGKRTPYPVAAFLSIPEKKELFKILKAAQDFQSLPIHRQAELRAEHTPTPEGP